MYFEKSVCQMPLKCKEKKRNRSILNKIIQYKNIKRASKEGVYMHVM